MFKVCFPGFQHASAFVRMCVCANHEQEQACEACWGDLLLAAAHLCRLSVVKLLNECAEKSGSPERLLMFDLPVKHTGRGHFSAV